MFDNVSGAFPNLLESITIKGDLAYVPGTCSSPNGPFRFNVNVQSCLSTIDIEQNIEAFKTLNMNVGVNFEPVGKRLFNTEPVRGGVQAVRRRRLHRAGGDESAAAGHAERRRVPDHQSPAQRRRSRQHHPDRAQGSGRDRPGR